MTQYKDIHRGRHVTSPCRPPLSFLASTAVPTAASGMRECVMCYTAAVSGAATAAAAAAAAAADFAAAAALLLLLRAAVLSCSVVTAAAHAVGLTE